VVALRKEKDPPPKSEMGGAGIADSAYKLRLAAKSRIFVGEKPWGTLILSHCRMQKTTAECSLWRLRQRRAKSRDDEYID
jgi:hypothetical protein